MCEFTREFHKPDVTSSKTLPLSRDFSGLRLAPRAHVQEAGRHTPTAIEAETHWQFSYETIHKFLVETRNATTLTRRSV